MKTLNVHLEHCYGIRKLSHGFDFSERNAIAVYAANGSMKTSFAQTFKDLADDKASMDRIFPARTTVRTITDEAGTQLPAGAVVVLAPYDEFFGHTEKTSTLLVNNVLRKEYEGLHEEVEKSKTAFLEAMKKQSGSKRPLDSEIALAIMKDDQNDAFYLALDRIRNELAEQKDAPFADIKYDLIFDDRIIDAIKGDDFKTAIQAYITRYNELLAASSYFKKGVFEYYNASQIAKTLADNGFFDAKHTITLHAGAAREIRSQKELEKLIAEELENITKDAQLKTKFSAIKKLLEKNVTVREFQKYICDHELLLPQLSNIALFKEQIWKSYFKVHETLYLDLLEKYSRVKARRKAIEDEARREATQWEVAIALFNERFSVPFTLEAKNKMEVRLGSSPMLDLSYTFKDGGGETSPVVRETLLQTLSQGEKKALYILNVIFEVEVRRQAKQDTLFVIDDIADSFDYRNKYAIIQYLQDIADGSSAFKQIILTHNFDFFRTVKDRFVGYPQCLMTTRRGDETVLEQASGVDNPFVNDWKKDFFVDAKKRVACIPFMRNLIQYISGDTDPQFIRLTSLLHWMTDSDQIRQDDLGKMFNWLFATTTPIPEPDKLVVDLIDEEAKKCLGAPAGINFENKIVLSIAIRLKAERYMVGRINDAAFVAGIKKNQTRVLLNRFRKSFGNEGVALRVLDGVALMTPENIHLNSFMYEPILDMADDHLRKLYQEVAALS